MGSSNPLKEIESTLRPAAKIGLGVLTLGQSTQYNMAKDAKDAAAAQAQQEQAIIAKQEAEIAKKLKDQERVRQERSDRMSKNELLSGSETGVDTQYTGGLLS